MNLKKVLKKSLSITTVICMILTSVSCAFTDLSTDHWAYDAVGEMVDRNVLSGYNDGTFKPDSKITRAEFATILVKTLDIKEVTAAIDFKDVEGIHWAEAYIDLANTFLTGYVLNGEYYFKPEEPALREDAAVAIVSAKGLTNKDVDMSVLNKFSDRNDISENLKKYVAVAVDNGLMKGNANGTFNPQGNLTRAEVAALFNNIYEYEEEYEKIAIGEVIKEELPDFKLNEKDMSIDLGKDYSKYQFTFTGRESSYWYSASSSKISVAKMDTTWTGCPGISIREKDNIEKGYVKVAVPKYEATVTLPNGERITEEYVPLQTVRMCIQFEQGEETIEVEASKNIYKNNVELERLANGDISLSFKMPYNDVKIELDIKEVVEEEIEIPELYFDAENRNLSINDDWDKYQVSYSGRSQPGTWYEPYSLAIPVRNDEKIYLSDVGSSGDLPGTYWFIRIKNNTEAGYNKIRLPETISNEIEITSSNEVQKFARNFNPGDKFTITVANGKIDGHYWENGKIIDMTYLYNGSESFKQLNVKEIIDSGITMYGVQLQTKLIGATYEQENDNSVKLIFEKDGKKYYSIADVELNHADAQTFDNFFCYVLNNSEDVEIEIIEEEKLPDFIFDEDDLTLNLGEEWEKYELSFGETRPNGWYRPLLKSENPGALIPIRDNNKIYLEDVNVYDVAGGNVNYTYVRDKIRTDLGYATFEVPKNSLMVECNNATTNYGKRIMPTSNVSVYIRIDDGYTFDGLGELSNITENDISIKNINKNEFQLNFKMPFEDVVIEVKTQSNNEKVIPIGLAFPRAFDIEVGETRQLEIGVLPADASDKSLTYKSSDESIVVVDEEGYVTALKAGTARIEVIANGNKTITVSVLVRVSEPRISELKYAIVIKDDYKEGDKKFVELLTMDGTETLETQNKNEDYFKGAEDAFVDYRLIGSKLKEGNMLIYPKFFDVDCCDTPISGYLSSSNETKLAVNVDENTVKDNFIVDEFRMRANGVLVLIYQDDELETTLGRVYADPNAIVLDIRDGEIVESTISSLEDEISEEGDLYVVPFINSTSSEGYANVLVIVK